ncbi:hypothetical protein PMAYCL1PPCAC_03529, partial [Pristionchus mayeri]
TDASGAVLNLCRFIDENVTTLSKQLTADLFYIFSGIEWGLPVPNDLHRPCRNVFYSVAQERGIYQQFVAITSQLMTMEEQGHTTGAARNAATIFYLMAKDGLDESSEYSVWSVISPNPELFTIIFKHMLRWSSGSKAMIVLELLKLIQN